MSEASDKLARSRLAIIEQMARRERRHDPREEPSAGGWPAVHTERPDTGGLAGEGWFSRLVRAVRTWWHYHPANMVVELAAPALHAYASRKPMQLLGISAAVGAVIVMLRPWRLISLTTLVVAVVKSSQLSGVLMSALSAADLGKDDDRPG